MLLINLKLHKGKFQVICAWHCTHSSYCGTQKVLKYKRDHRNDISEAPFHFSVKLEKTSAVALHAAVCSTKNKPETCMADGKHTSPILFSTFISQFVWYFTGLMTDFS